MSPHGTSCLSPFSCRTGCVGAGLDAQVLEPKEERVVFKDWEKMGSEIAELGLWDDEEQPLPTSKCARDVCGDGCTSCGAEGAQWRCVLRFLC